MINLTAHWDEAAWETANRFLEAAPLFDETLLMTMEQMVHYAEEYFKPMLNIRTSPKGDGGTARSITHHISHHGEGFEATFEGLLSAHYMDVGNFDKGTTINATAKGIRFGFFPVDYRHGKQYAYSPENIHGMGSRTQGVPTHWSSRTVEHMAEDGVALEMAMKSFSEFLAKVVR